MAETANNEFILEDNTAVSPNGNNQILLGQKKERGRRPNIEDYMDTKPVRTAGGLDLTVGLVADGIGGENHGEVAAETTIKQTFKFIEESTANSPEQIPELLKRALEHANNEVFQMGRKNKEMRGMGCTAALAVIHNNKFYMANVGDSRIYLYRNAKLYQLTLDHTWAHDMVESGVLSEADALKHPKAEELARSIGYDANVNVDLNIYIKGVETPKQERQQQGRSLKAGDRLLICSDGLIKPRHDNAQLAYVTDEEIERILSAKPAPEAAVALVDKAIGRNADDNVTAVVLEMPGASYNKLAALPPWLLPAGLGGLVVLALVIAAILVLPSLFGGDESDVPPAIAEQSGGNGPTDNTAVGINPEPTRNQPTNTPPPQAALSDDVQIYGDPSAYETSGNNNITIQQGKFVVESAGSNVTIANSYGEQALLLGTGIMGIEYVEEPFAFTVHCFLGDCYVEGSVDGEQPLKANEAVMVGGGGRPGEVVATRNEEFVSITAVVPVPTAMPTPTDTATPEPTVTLAPTRISVPPPAQATATPTVEPITIIDTDGDGVPDNEDNCPTIPGDAEDNPGCPFSKEQQQSGIGGGNDDDDDDDECLVNPVTNQCEE